MAIDVNISSSDDFSFSSEIIDEATEGVAVPTAYHNRSGTVAWTKIKGHVPFVFSLSRTAREVRSRHEASIFLPLPF